MSRALGAKTSTTVGSYDWMRCSLDDSRMSLDVPVSSAPVRRMSFT